VNWLAEVFVKSLGSSFSRFRNDWPPSEKGKTGKTVQFDFVDTADEAMATSRKTRKKRRARNVPSEVRWGGIVASGKFQVNFLAALGQRTGGSQV